MIYKHFENKIEEGFLKNVRQKAGETYVKARGSKVGKAYGRLATKLGSGNVMFDRDAMHKFLVGNKNSISHLEELIKMNGPDELPTPKGYKGDIREDWLKKANEYLNILKSEKEKSERPETNNYEKFIDGLSDDRMAIIASKLFKQ